MQPNLQSAFAEQSAACASLGSAFMADLMQILPEVWPEDTRLAALCANWPGEVGPREASLPLRIAGGLHALVLQAAAPELAALYPPAAFNAKALRETLPKILRTHDDFLCDWIASPPQTNETGRSAVLIAASAALASLGLPLKLSELGASAGLNLMFDRYHLQASGQSLGPEASPLRLAPEWSGPPPLAAQITVAERRGCDLNPLDPAKDAGRLLAYVWPDQPARLARMRAALSLAEAKLDRADAADWLDRRLRSDWPGQCHLVYHTIAFQYFPSPVQARIRAAMQEAGARATPEAPLAWLAMEADGGARGAGVTLQLWPSGERVELARAGFHGEWIAWGGQEGGFLPPSALRTSPPEDI
jgi:hypothetical protein